MKNPRIKTKVVHSQSKSAWNIIGDRIGEKYKIARIPYEITLVDNLDHKNRKDAFEHAEFISWCFNNSDKILNDLK